MWDPDSRGCEDAPHQQEGGDDGVDRPQHADEQRGERLCAGHQLPDADAYRGNQQHDSEAVQPDVARDAALQLAVPLGRRLERLIRQQQAPRMRQQPPCFCMRSVSRMLTDATARHQRLQCIQLQVQPRSRQDKTKAKAVSVHPSKMVVQPGCLDRRQARTMRLQQQQRRVMSARHQAFTKAHHRMALAMLANHSASKCLNQ